METDHPQYSYAGNAKSVQGDLSHNVYPFSCFGSCNTECEIPCDVSPEEWRFKVYEAQADPAQNAVVANEMGQLEQQVRTARQQMAATFQSSGQPNSAVGTGSSGLFGNGPLSTALPPSSNNKLVLFGETDATGAPAAATTTGATLAPAESAASAATGSTPAAAPIKPATPLAAFEADAFSFSFLPELPPPRALA